MAKPWEADITVNEALVRSLLVEQFPHLDPFKISWFNEGWDNTLFLINDRLLFRFPRRLFASKLIETESRLLPGLARCLPVPVPNPIYLGQPTETYPFHFFGYASLEGDPVHRVVTSDTQRAAATVDWANFLSHLHSLPIEQTLDWGISPTDEIGRVDLEKRVPLYMERVEEAYDKKLIHSRNPYGRWIESMNRIRNHDLVTKRAVVHGDLNFRNFLIDTEGRLAGVIDWGDAHIGHPAVDLAVAYSYIPPRARNEFFRRYGQVDDTTRLLAQFIALYINLTVLIYAHDIGDQAQLQEARRALASSLA